MFGAKALDKSILRGTRIINIDSEVEGVITVGCAGGVRCNVSIPVDNSVSDIPDHRIKLEISGHTDNAGSLQHNKMLSEKRSDAVKKYLVSLGCKESNIKSIGYGSEKPVAPNTTEEGKAQNRRVEFKIYE